MAEPAKDVQLVRISLLVDGKEKCVENAAWTAEDCYRGDPYQIFIVETLEDGVRVVSPVMGTCLSIEKDGKASVSSDCRSNNALLRLTKDARGYTFARKHGGKCVAVPGTDDCIRYSIHRAPGSRIYWNTRKLAPLYPIRTRDAQTAQGWALRWDADVEQELFRRVLQASTGPNRAAAWRGRKTAQKKVVWVLGDSGVGKSRIVDALSDERVEPHLDQPIHISWDNPLDYIPEVARLLNLHENSDVVSRYLSRDPRPVSDAEIIDQVYERAGRVETELQTFATEREIDLIVEKADYPSAREVARFLALNYQPFAVFLSVEEPRRREQVVERFARSGRYGKKERVFTPERTAEWIRANPAVSILAP